MASTFDFKELQGWIDDAGLREEAFSMLPDHCKKPFEIKGATGDTKKRMMLFEVVRKVLGEEPENIRQLIGDCTVQSTQVRMSDGRTKNIEDIQVGEYVMTHLNRSKRVTRTIKKPYTGNIVKVKAKGHYEELKTTEDHLYLRYSNEDSFRYEWKACGKMEVGVDNVLIPFFSYEDKHQENQNKRSNDLGLIKEIESLDKESVDNISVYCLDVEDDHSFIANGYAIHNCVSWGAKHAIEYLQCTQIALGNLSEFKLVYSPYLYGCGRVFIGGNRMWGDGSVGVWQAQAVMKYGTIPMDGPGVPPYSASNARKFGSSESALNQFVPMGKEHLIKTTTKISTWDQLVDAITNYYPVTVASNVGFDMTPRSDGFHHYSTSWPHQMCIIGVDAEGGNIPEHVCILNSWSDVHGHLTDLRDPSLKWPIGTLRVLRRDVERILAADDSWAYSSMVGFPAQTLPEEFFDMIR